MLPDFNSMIQTARRDDDYINASAWCKQYGKQLNHYLSNKEAKAFIKVLEDKVHRNSDELVLKPGRGKKGDT